MSTIGTVDADRDAVVAVWEETPHTDAAFLDRLREHFPALHEATSRLVGDAPDGADLVHALVAAASEGWHARSLDLKVHGEVRGSDRLTSRHAVGVSCFVDRYAGNLAGLTDEIAALGALGATVLHLQSPFARRPGGTADLRRIDPGLGSLARLADLSAGLRLAGISLAVDAPVEAPATAFVADLLFLANHGVEAFVVDDPAVAAVAREVLAIGAPGVAVVAPPASAAPLWEALATGDAAPLQRDVVTHGGEVRLVAVRDADALTFGPDADRLTAFYAEGASFARGVGVPGGVAGTTASLAGVESGDPLGVARVILAHALVLAAPGVPMIVWGDEVAQLNDDTVSADPLRRGDPRWVHRGQKPRDRYAQARDAGSAPGRVQAAVRALIAARHATPEFDGTRVLGFDVPVPSVVGWQRPGDAGVMLVLANTATEAASVGADTLSGFAARAIDVVGGGEVDLRDGVALPACGFRWLRATPIS
ncbi:MULTISPECIES: hypothetical protein [unclassified Microbacterium]|uniref:hypothetical protein n=1 Tax=unclassified Microbacterium TaxID=2609290 RepID=UPI0038672B40